MYVNKRNRPDFSGLTGQLTTQQREQIMQLLDLRKEPPVVSHLAWLREPPREAKPINFQRAGRSPGTHSGRLACHWNWVRLFPITGCSNWLNRESAYPADLQDLADTQESLAILVAFFAQQNSGPDGSGAADA